VKYCTAFTVSLSLSHGLVAYSASRTGVCYQFWPIYSQVTTLNKLLQSKQYNLVLGKAQRRSIIYGLDGKTTGHQFFTPVTRLSSA